MLYSCLAVQKHVAIEVFASGGKHRLEGWGLCRPSEPPPSDRNAIFVEETAAFLGVAGEPLCSIDDAVRTQEVVDAVGDAIRHRTAVAHR